MSVTVVFSTPIVGAKALMRLPSICRNPRDVQLFGSDWNITACVVSEHDAVSIYREFCSHGIEIDGLDGEQWVDQYESKRRAACVATLLREAMTEAVPCTEKLDQCTVHQSSHSGTASNRSGILNSKQRQSTARKHAHKLTRSAQKRIEQMML